MPNPDRPPRRTRRGNPHGWDWVWVVVNVVIGLILLIALAMLSAGMVLSYRNWR